MYEILSEAAERNKKFILEVMKDYFDNNSSEKLNLLEIGSGNAQHGCFISNKMPKLQWYFSDIDKNIQTIKDQISGIKQDNLHGPLKIEIGVDDLPKDILFDCVFTANTFHIMSWKHCKTLMKVLSRRLSEGSFVFIYGPFNYNNNYTSESNQKFDQHLKLRDSKSGIRNFEDVVKSFQKYNFKLFKDHEMPANNRMLVFEKLKHLK